MGKDFKFVEHFDSDGRGLAHAPPLKKAPKVADSRTFLKRFHRRTGGILRDVDWSHMRAIGGMVVACLVADENVFATQFEGLDVDLCFVGISGEELQKKVVYVVQSICQSAEKLRIAVAVIRTPLTVTLNLRLSTGVLLPSVQVVMKPYLTSTHLVCTTDLNDCTAMAFDGQALFAAPRAREAIATRRNIARPEKYHTRGEWVSEEALLKYAMRGFRVVDIGIQADCRVAPVEGLSSKVRRAWRLPIKLHCRFHRLELNQFISHHISDLRFVGVHGARLLMLAEQHDDLRRFMLAKATLVHNGPSGLSGEELSILARSSPYLVSEECAAKGIDALARHVIDHFANVDFRAVNQYAGNHLVRDWYDGTQLRAVKRSFLL